MSSIPNSHINPNPNLNQPSASNPSKLKRKNKNRRKKTRKSIKNKRKSSPNWLELPEDIWFLILSKVRTIYLIEDVQKVCMLFRKLCKQPDMYRIMDMQLPDGYGFMELEYDLNVMTRFAVDTSAGCLEDIYLEYICDDDTLSYIAERSKNLKHLRLGHYIHVSDKGLIEALKSLPMLEEVQIILCKFSVETIENIGRSCQSLKSFSLNDLGSKSRKWICNEEALAVARSMPDLRQLQLIGNSMTNVGLQAILDGCPHLDSLDLRACFHINLSGPLVKRCEKIKLLRRPHDSTTDYHHATCTSYDSESTHSDDGYYSVVDSDLEYLPDFPSQYADYEEFLNDYPDYFDHFDDFSLYHGYFGGGGHWDDDSSD